jgi:HopA1 effector protein family
MSSMQQALQAQLMAIMHAVTFPAPGVAAVGGRTLPGVAAGSLPTRTPDGNVLVTQLQALFYEHCYCRPFEGAATDHLVLPSPSDDLAPSLTAANPSRDHWDAGWQVKQNLPNGQIVAAKGALTRMAWPGEFHSHGPPGTPVQPGAEISLFAARESLQMQPGFYFAFGEILADQQEDYGIVRFYWNISAHGAPRLVGALTAALNRFAIPFRFKCLRMPALFDRSDSAVLFVARRYYRIVTMLLPEIYAAVRNELEPAVPLFSKRLADGLGFAEDPQTGESFGMNRCRLMAEAVCRAHGHGQESAQARLSEIAAIFAAAGLSLERPYLRADGADPYDLAERLVA